MAKQEPSVNPDFELHSSLKNRTLAIVSTEWNRGIVDKMKDGAIKTLKDYGISEEQILVKEVPGSFELPLGAQHLMEYGQAWGVICLGCVIKGETSHDHYINEAVATKLAELNLVNSIPAIFGVLTTDNEEQAQARAGGEKGNKGSESAISLLKMLNLKEELKSSNHGKIGLFKNKGD